MALTARIDTSLLYKRIVQYTRRRNRRLYFPHEPELDMTGPGKNRDGIARMLQSDCHRARVHLDVNPAAALIERR